MQKQAHLTASVGLLLGKKREDQEKQRVLFENLSAPGLLYLKVQMNQFSRPPGGGDEENGDERPGLDPEDVPANLRARAAHLADETASTSILELIFGGVTKKARRETLDDKSTRNKDLWKLLCDDFFNSPNWMPENEQTDTKVSTINPRAAPLEPYAPEKLRALFSALRTQYTIFNSRYHLSGQIEEGNGAGDDDFFDNFVRGDIVYMY
ncbi:hypothetical protein B484DRAFT_464354, partial [Ochromonadaceae sp. CCMP2298]